MTSFSINSKDIRKFGGIAFIFFGCLCALGSWKQKVIPTYLFGFLSLLELGFILLPVQLKPLYKGWLKIAKFIGRTVNIAALVTAYYLIITPVALLIRMFKGALLPMKPDRNLPSYWVTRTEPAQPRERFSKRF